MSLVKSAIFSSAMLNLRAAELRVLPEFLLRTQTSAGQIHVMEAPCTIGSASSVWV